MLSRALDHRHLAEAREPLPDDIAAFRGITLGAALGVAFYVTFGVLLFLIWELA